MATKHDARTETAAAGDADARPNNADELARGLRAGLARLRGNPRSIPDRLEVAGIHLQLGHIGEALTHYEGVLRSYIQAGHVVNAIDLCRQVLHARPDLPRLGRILAALQSRAPQGASPASPPQPEPAPRRVVSTDPEPEPEQRQEGPALLLTRKKKKK